MLIATFELHGVKVEVHRIDTRKWKAHCKKHDVLDKNGNEPHAYWDPTLNKIFIESGLDTVQEQRVLCHEVTHAILDFMNHRLSRNEPFVDNFGSHWHQMWTTFEARPRRKRKGSGSQ